MKVKCPICDKEFAKDAGRQVHISLQHLAKGVTTREQHLAKAASR